MNKSTINHQHSPVSQRQSINISVQQDPFPGYAMMMLSQCFYTVINNLSSKAFSDEDNYETMITYDSSPIELQRVRSVNDRVKAFRKALVIFQQYIFA